MQALASFIMRGRSQAAVVFVALAVLTAIVPPLSFLCVATVGLVTLRNNVGEAGILLAAVLLLAVLLNVLGIENVLLPATLVAMFALSLVVTGLAYVLRRFRSLPLTLLVAAVIGALVVVASYIALGDPAEWWHTQLAAMFAPMLGQADVAEQQMLQQSIDQLAPHMAGFMAAAFCLNTIVCLFIARWWQAMLYNPSGFQGEFHELRLGKSIAYIAMTLAVLSMFDMGMVSAIAGDLLKVVLTLFVLQGLAVIHAVTKIKGLHKMWLAGVYVVMILMSQLIAMAGFIDTWTDFRKRVKQSNQVV